MKNAYLGKNASPREKRRADMINNASYDKVLISAKLVLTHTHTHCHTLPHTRY